MDGRNKSNVSFPIPLVEIMGDRIALERSGSLEIHTVFNVYEQILVKRRSIKPFYVLIHI